MVRILFVFCFLLFYSCLQAQDFRGENKVFVTFETKDKKTIVFESYRLTVEVNVETDQFDLVVDINTFQSLSGNKYDTLWNELFDEILSQDFSYRALFSPSQYDPQIDKPQTIEMGGVFHVAENKVDIPLQMTIQQMDRFMLVSFKEKLKLSMFNMVVPEKYQTLLTGNFSFEVLNGKITAGFR